MPQPRMGREGTIVVKVGAPVTTDQRCGPDQVTTVTPRLTGKSRYPAVSEPGRSPDT